MDKKYIPSTNQSYWIPKIERNIERDKEVNFQLAEQGWTVLRFWQKDIEKNMEICLQKIENALFNTI